MKPLIVVLAVAVLIFAALAGLGWIMYKATSARLTTE
jgi:hypothetical protein